MDYNLVLPPLALVLTALATLLSPRTSPPSPPPRAWLIEMRSGAVLAAVAILLFAGATLVWPDTFRDGAWVALAVAIGAAAAFLAGTAEPGRPALPFGLAVVAASVVPFAGPGTGPAQFALIVGAFVGAFAMGREGSSMNAFATTALVGGDLLGRIAEPGSPAASHSGTIMGVAGLLAIAGWAGARRVSTAVAEGTLFGALLGLGFLGCWQFLGSPELASIWAGGVVIAGVVHLLLKGEEQPDSFRFVLASVIWIAAGSIAFGMNLGYGLAICLLAGASFLVGVGNVRAVMSMSVLAAILIYRLFRETHPEETRALDIGQHYTMVGVCLGALIPLLPLEWAKSRTRSSSVLAKALWLIILLSVPVASAIVLGSKGAIGMILGLSFAAIVEGLRGGATLAPSAIAVGLASLTSLSFTWLGPWMNLERAEKQRAVIIMAIVAVLLGVAFFLLGRPRSDAESK